LIGERFGAKMAEMASWMRTLGKTPVWNGHIEWQRENCLPGEGRGLSLLSGLQNTTWISALAGMTWLRLRNESLARLTRSDFASLLRKKLRR
jgi:hypothetical protein